MFDSIVDWNRPEMFCLFANSLLSPSLLTFLSSQLYDFLSSYHKEIILNKNSAQQAQNAENP